MTTSEQQSGEQQSDEPKYYKGGKSKALRALKSIGEHAVAAADKLLFQSATDGAWGFYPLDAKATQDAGERAAQQEVAPPQSAPEVLPQDPQIDQANTDSVVETVFPNDNEQSPAGGDGSEPETEHNEGQAANVFGATANQLTSTPAAAPAPAQRAQSRTTYTIEKNRPEQNGIKRPSAGGLCRAVWDACDDLRAKLDRIPTSKEIKQMAGEKSWNSNNTMIEFYQWRRYNGITGRSAKAEAQAPAPAAPATPEQQTA
jgi:hypothetical protein